jgi:hypothetical protein
MDGGFGSFREIHTHILYLLHLFSFFLPYNYKCSLLMGLHSCFEVVEVCLHSAGMGLNSLLGGSVTMEDLRGRFGEVGRDVLSREVLLSSRVEVVHVAVGRGGGG